jgi:hypothetical protein
VDAEYVGTPPASIFRCSIKKSDLQEAAGDAINGSRLRPSMSGAAIPASWAKVGARSTFSTRCPSRRGAATRLSARRTNGTRMLSS